MPKKSPGPGRPPSISKTIIAEIANALRAGAYMETAAALAGVNKTTLYTWLKLGAKGSKGIYVEFRNAVTKAMAESEMRDILNIDKAAMGQIEEYERYPEGTWRTDDETGERINLSGAIRTTSNGKPILKRVGISPNWAASAWRLERKAPKRWAKTEKTMELEDHDDVEGSKGVEIHFVDPPKKK